MRRVVENVGPANVKNFKTNVKIKLKLKHYLLHIDGEIDHFLIRLSPNDKG